MFRMYTFPVKTKDELQKFLIQFDYIEYGKSRNYIDGSVSKLSPYITHGVITVPECIQIVMNQSTVEKSEKFLMELLWKEFFMQVQITYGNSFLQNIIWNEKTGIHKERLLSEKIINGKTNTERVNKTVQELQNSGWLHNHKRMRLASWVIHRAKLDRKKFADRTYYHFLDGELSSNHLSRQRVNSTFSAKAYFMNEDNIKKYRPKNYDENLRGSYDEIAEKLFDTNRISEYWTDNDIYDTLQTPIDTIQEFSHDLLIGGEKIFLLSPRKLDHSILSNTSQKIVILDKEFTKQYPWSQKRLDFVKQYCDYYCVPFILGDYNLIIETCIKKYKEIILDARFDPVYSDIQKTYTNYDSVIFLAYDMINKNPVGKQIMKFFTYWNMTLPFIKSLKYEPK